MATEIPAIPLPAPLYTCDNIIDFIVCKLILLISNGYNTKIAPTNMLANFELFTYTALLTELRKRKKTAVELIKGCKLSWN